MPLVFGGAGKPLPKTLAKSEKRRIEAECRVAFSLDTFFWSRKRKYFGCRADKSAGLPICMRSTRRAKNRDVFRETDFEKTVAIATPNQSKPLKQKIQRGPYLKPLRFQRHNR